MFKKAFATLSALTLIVGLSACSNETDSGSGTDSASPEPSSSTDTSAAETVYKITSDSVYAPFEFEESGSYVGIDIEILAKIAEIEGFKYEMTNPGFDAAIQAVAAGQADGVIAGMSITEPRKDTYDFSDPYYNAGITIGMKKGSEGSVTAYGDLKDKKIGAKIATTSESWCEENKATYGFAECVGFEDGVPMYDSLENGGIDALLDDSPIIGYAISQGRELVMPIDSIEAVAGLGFAVKRGENADLLTKFNSGLAKIKADGSYLEILKKYNAESGAVD
ncbi:MAG: transporter substrate-binding domain-containing protein [Bifidobacteriaceae bacterium]|jgi:polar amino acid transport system substrate-binding protein|nr:transporter substrate-binding domain-containing protein [Bifidobacteriaceae bacterium]